jgi:hypothetical protein
MAIQYPRYRTLGSDDGRTFQVLVRESENEEFWTRLASGFPTREAARLWAETYHAKSRPSDRILFDELTP